MIKQTFGDKMTDFGKVFIFENRPEHLKPFQESLEAQGFFVFGFDNLYQFLQYAGEINPDIVIMNFGSDFNPDAKTWKTVEKSLCQKNCPEIYLNATAEFQNRNKFHHVEFSSDTLKKDQILSIIKKNPKNYLH